MPRKARPPSNLLGQVLREQRGDRTVQDVAAALGCAHSTLTRLEQGQSAMSASLALAIARWLGWTMERVVEAAGRGPREEVERVWPLRKGEGPWPGEDEVFANTLDPLVQDLPDVVRENIHYIFLEMLNNAFDHADASSIVVLLEIDAEVVLCRIDDDGVGIFRKLAATLGIQDERMVPIELFKGKLTTNPTRHAGEGIFFSSRLADYFWVESGDTEVARYNAKIGLEEEALYFARSRFQGTRVSFVVRLDTQRTARQVFDAYSDPDDHTFSRTHAIVSLVGVGQEQLVSRSQARRLLSRLDLFREAELDFSDVDDIGQPFADEIFRVWQREHPDIRLIPTHANDNINRMIAHVKPRSE